MSWFLWTLFVYFVLNAGLQLVCIMGYKPKMEPEHYASSMLGSGLFAMAILSYGGLL